MTRLIGLVQKVDDPKYLWIKIILLIVTHAVLFFKLKYFLMGIISSLGELNVNAKATNILYLDIFFLIVFIGLFFFLFSLLVVILKETFRQNYPGRHPLLLFISLAAVITPAFVLAPTYLTDIFLAANPNQASEYNWDSLDILPNVTYLKAAIITSLSLALFLSDLVVKKGALHWWTAPFFIVPSRLFNLFPILWWSFLTRWIPSRIWNIWLPVLLFLTCLYPAMVFPISQPIRNYEIEFGKDSFVPISEEDMKCYAYFATWVPEKSEFYMRCSQKLHHVERTITPDIWKSKDSLFFDFKWSIASLDFAGNAAYVFDAQNHRLYTVGLETLDVLHVDKIPLRSMPHTDEMVRQAIDPVKKRLYIGLRDEFIGAFDVSKNPVRHLGTRYVQPCADRIVELLYEQEFKSLVLLQMCKLTILDPNDLSVIRKLDFDYTAAGIAVHPEKRELYISFPDQLRVDIFDYDSLMKKDSIAAPIGVRNLAVDDENGYLFMTSMTGIIEISSLEDFRTVVRVRDNPWVHWATASPSQKRLIITSGCFWPVIYNYDVMPAGKDFMVRVISGFEKIYHYTASIVNINPTVHVGDASVFHKIESGEAQEILKDKKILLAVPNAEDSNMGQAILEWASAEVTVATNLDQIKNTLTKNNNFDVLIFDYDLEKPQDEQSLRNHFSLPTFTKLIFSTSFEARKKYGMQADDETIARPYFFNELITKVVQKIEDD